MKIFLTFINLIIALSFTFGQSDESTIYKNIETVKSYSVRMYSQTGNGKDIYEINDRSVSKAYFQKFNSTRESLKNCKPCILVSYDENDVLLRRSVSYQDCGVGWFKTYHPNGRLKSEGSNKENPTGNWSDIWNRGYCNVRIGKWSYFNEKGEFIYADFWDNGQFINQVPEQDEIEVWDVELALNGEKIEKQAMPIDQIGNLKITPKYKNKNTYSEITISLEISAGGYKPNKPLWTESP